MTLMTLKPHILCVRACACAYLYMEPTACLHTHAEKKLKLASLASSFGSHSGNRKSERHRTSSSVIVS